MHAINAQLNTFYRDCMYTAVTIARQIDGRHESSEIESYGTPSPRRKVAVVDFTHKKLLHLGDMEMTPPIWQKSITFGLQRRETVTSSSRLARATGNALRF